MSSDRRYLPEEADEAAIHQVLEAERAARERIEGARQEAVGLIADARREARRIQERTDARVIRLRAACQRRVAQRAAELERAAQDMQSIPVQQDERYARLDEAVARLAAALTGGDIP
jgi:vacuolar-type H+-ATPase subunit H